MTILRVTLAGVEFDASRKQRLARRLGGHPASLGRLAPVFDAERQARIRAHFGGD